jgi:hypothetical protein
MRIPPSGPQFAVAALLQRMSAPTTPTGTSSQTRTTAQPAADRSGCIRERSPSQQCWSPRVGEKLPSLF